MNWIYSLFNKPDEPIFVPLEVDHFTRHIHQPREATSIKIRKEEGINSNWRYRQYLQQNGEQINIRNNIQYAQVITPVHSSYSHTTLLCSDEKGDLMENYLANKSYKSRLISPVIVVPKDITD